MSNINSSGSVERFTLGVNESKEFEVLPPGGTSWVVDVHGDIIRTIEGGISGTPATVALQTRESFDTGTSWEDVQSVTVAAGGVAVMSGRTGRYGRIVNTGPGIVHVVAKPTHRVQVRTAL